MTPSGETISITHRPRGRDEVCRACCRMQQLVSARRCRFGQGFWFRETLERDAKGEFLVLVLALRALGWELSRGQPKHGRWNPRSITEQPCL